MATTVYVPGTTDGKEKLPSESLWSLRNMSWCVLGSLGKSTTITPEAALLPLFTNPSILVLPSASDTLHSFDSPGFSVISRPETWPSGEVISTTEYVFVGANTRTV